MEPEYYANYLANDMVAIIVCRKCKHKEPFLTLLDGSVLEKEDEGRKPANFPINLTLLYAACAQKRGAYKLQSGNNKPRAINKYRQDLGVWI